MKQKKKRINLSTVSGAASGISLVFAVGSVGALSDFNIGLLQGVLQIGVSMLAAIFFGAMATAFEKQEKDEKRWK